MFFFSGFRRDIAERKDFLLFSFFIPHVSAVGKAFRDHDIPAGISARVLFHFDLHSVRGAACSPEIQSAPEIRFWRFVHAHRPYSGSVDSEGTPDGIVIMPVRRYRETAYVVYRHITIFDILPYGFAVMVDYRAYLDKAFGFVVPPSETYGFFVHAQESEAKAEELVPVTLFGAVKVIGAAAAETDVIGNGL